MCTVLAKNGTKQDNRKNQVAKHVLVKKYKSGPQQFCWHAIDK